MSMKVIPQWLCQQGLLPVSCDCICVTFKTYFTFKIILSVFDFIIVKLFYLTKIPRMIHLILMSSFVYLDWTTLHRSSREPWVECFWIHFLLHIFSLVHFSNGTLNGTSNNVCAAVQIQFWPCCLYLLKDVRVEQCEVSRWKSANRIVFPNQQFEVCHFQSLKRGLCVLMQTVVMIVVLILCKVRCCPIW